MTGGKQSQLLVVRLSLEFDKIIQGCLKAPQLSSVYDFSYVCPSRNENVKNFDEKFRWPHLGLSKGVASTLKTGMHEKYQTSINEDLAEM